MHRSNSWSWVALVVASGVAAGCGSSDLCDAEEVQAALDAARDGDIVTIAGACAPVGPLFIPSGVTLTGGPDARVVAPANGVAVVLTSGASPATLTGLTVQAGGRVGVLVRGDGAAAIRAVAVSATRGVAVAAENAASLAIEDVMIDGPVNDGNASDSRFLRVVAARPPPGTCPMVATCDCTPGDLEAGTERVCDTGGHWAEVSATYGLYLENATATLARVDVRGFAELGVVLIESDVTWNGGSVRDTLGVGVRQVGGQLTMQGVQIASTLQGVRGAPVYGMAATDGARIVGTALEVSDNDRYGIMLVGGGISLTDLAAERNGDAALWIAECDDVTVDGAATSIADNAFAGVVVASSMNVLMRDVTISGTTESMRAVGTLGARRVGDGLHVIETTSTLELDAVTLRDNERMGALFDLGATGMGEGFTFVNVMVDGAGPSLGAVAGRVDAMGRLTPVAPGTWDTGVARAGATVANDVAVSGLFDAMIQNPDAPGVDERVGVIAPMF